MTHLQGWTPAPAWKKFRAGAVLVGVLAIAGCGSTPDLPTAPPIATSASTSNSTAEGTGAAEQTPPSAPPEPPASSVPDPTPSAAPAVAAGLPRSIPTRVSIPELGVESTLIKLGLQKDGSMAVPEGADPVGWFTGSPTPGQSGPAVLAGHVTWNGERGVFFYLGQMVPGQRISVDRADGRTVAYAVTRVQTYAKDAFPTLAVYGNTSGPELRLITCAGDYDPSAEQPYDANVVVYARALA